MKQVAKLLIINNHGQYLLMQRNNHPTFGNDPDLAGGTLEEGELPLQTMIREVFEEIGVSIDENEVNNIFEGTEYSEHGTHYSLFVVKLNNTPNISLSWEHLSYEWIARDEFLEKVKNAKDTYMHMVYDVVKKKLA